MIGQNLRVLMAERDFNIQDIADGTGLSRTTISALCNDAGKGVQFETIGSLSKFLGVDPGDLFRNFLAIREAHK